MAHSHHGCQSPRDYFMEQLLTILVCGALGVVGIKMFVNGIGYDPSTQTGGSPGPKLWNILAPQFHIPVLIGSIAVLGLVVMRAVSVWREAGQLQPIDDMNCQENHVHTAACNHLPGLPGGATDPNLADDGHSHDMSWMFARMLILAFPITLFALGIPNAGFSQEYLNKVLGKDAALNLDPKELEKMAKAEGTEVVEDTTEQPDGTYTRVLKTKEGLKIREVTSRAGGEAKYSMVVEQGIAMSFNELNDAAFDADKRKSYTGQTAILEGKFNRISDTEFTLYRLKMTCCGADTIPLKVRIISPQPPAANNGEWVRVRGVIRFIKAPGQDRYTPVLRLNDATDVSKDVKVRNEYEY